MDNNPKSANECKRKDIISTEHKDIYSISVSKREGTPLENQSRAKYTND